MKHPSHEHITILDKYKTSETFGEVVVRVYGTGLSRHIQKTQKFFTPPKKIEEWERQKMGMQEKKT